jgi:hypothetical protein
MCNLQNILTIQEMKKNNPSPIKLETIDIEDDQPPPAPKVEVSKAKFVVYPPKAQSTPKEVPKEMPPLIVSQSNVNVVQRNVQSPTIYSASSSKPDSKQNQVQTSIQINGHPLKAIIKKLKVDQLQPLTREYVIPLKDLGKEKPNIATMRRQSAAPMTIIHNTSPEKIMSNEVTSLKSDGPSNTSFSNAVKRRASVGTPSAVSREIKSPPHLNLIRVLPSKEFRCTECLTPFATSRLLKYHEDNGLCDRQHVTTSRALNSFKCLDCNSSFASYYFLRRHRDACTQSLKVKCTYQYCRFRATNPGDIQKHFNEVHADKLKCKECDEVLPSQAALIAHEVMKHGSKEDVAKKRAVIAQEVMKRKKEEVAKKRALKQRQVRAAKRAKADLDFDSNTLTECEQCSLEIQPRDLASHMMMCKKKK